MMVSRDSVGSKCLALCWCWSWALVDGARDQKEWAVELVVRFLTVVEKGIAVYFFYTPRCTSTKGRDGSY